MENLDNNIKCSLCGLNECNCKDSLTDTTVTETVEESEPSVAVKRNINFEGVDTDKNICPKKALLLAGASVVAIGVTGGILYLAKKNK